MIQEPNYWVDFWKNYGEKATDKDEQTQVLRTFNKQPISKKIWDFTLKDIQKQIGPCSEDLLLDLCCGNGLISRYFSPMVKNIVAVDISEDLLRSVNRFKYPNIELIAADIRNLNFDKCSFNKIIIYAGIQYLTLAETTNLFEKVYCWLKPGGIFFLGDIPNYNKRWIFYDNFERQRIYFENLKKGKEIVGTWFEPEFFEKLGSFVNFRDSMYLAQHSDLIYSSYRYDYKLIK